MAIGIVTAALGLLIAAACIMIPRVVARRNDPYDDADALEYEEETGRAPCSSSVNGLPSQAHPLAAA